MLETRTNPRLADLWDHAKASDMSEPQLLLYRSNLLGSDKRITNYGGGNTSAKVMEKDPLTGEPVEVLWVKGSGGDVGTIKLDGFATLYQSKLEGLKKLYRGVEHEDEMVGYLPHCTFNLNARAASIDTPLHAFVPKKHVDHMHPDAIIAIAAAKNSKELTARIFGGEIGWLPWKRPGFELGLWLEKFCRDNPQATGVVLESHGLFTWGDTAQARATKRRSASSTAPSNGSRARPRARRLRRRGSQDAAGGRAPRHRRTADAGDPRHDLGQTSARSGHFDDQSGRAGIRRLEGAGQACRPRHQLPRPFPADENPAAGGRFRSGQSRRRQDACWTGRGDRGISQGLCRLLRALQACR